MAIVLMILKIIGITLLVILGLILLLVLVILFDPIGYKVEGSYKDIYDLKASVHWIFHIISVQLLFAKYEKHLFIKIFGIKIMDLFAPKKEKGAKKKKSKKDPSAVEIAKDIEASKEIEELENIEETEDAVIDLLHIEDAEKLETIEDVENFKNSEALNDTEDLNNLDEFKDLDESEDLNESEDDDIDSKIESLLQKIQTKVSSFFQNMKQLVVSFISKGKAIVEKIQSTSDKAGDLKKQADQKIHYIQKWIYVLSLDKTKLCIEAVKDELIKVIKHILPKKWKLFLHFGFEDPATTGNLLGYYWMFAVLCMDHMTCVPDFENQVLEANGYFKGRIQLYVLAITAYKFFFDKKFKYIRNLKKRVDAMK